MNTARYLLALPWVEGLQESVHLLNSFVSVIAGGDGGPAVRVPRIADRIDVVAFIFFTVLQFLLNWGIRILLVEPFARFVLKPSSEKRKKARQAALQDPAQREKLIKKEREKVDKFAQTAMEQIFYGAFTIFGFIIVKDQVWAWPSSLWWKGFLDTAPHPITGELHGIHSYMTYALAGYYIIYASRYAQAMISVCMEHKRKDFLEMQIHHFTTVLLVSISYIHGWNRVGVIIMLLLDPADVFLHCAKMFLYVGEARCDEKKNEYQFIADRLFEVFAGSFFIMRLVLYPYVCWSAHIESARYFPQTLPESTCVFLLYILLILQIYWFFLILKVAYKMTIQGHADDVRSDDEGDHPTKPAVTRKKKKKASKKAD